MRGLYVIRMPVLWKDSYCTVCNHLGHRNTKSVPPFPHQADEGPEYVVIIFLAIWQSASLVILTH